VQDKYEKGGGIGFKAKGVGAGKKKKEVYL
jgi:hypothetical protein